MSKILSQTVPWGRSLDEYARMFALSAFDLKAKILDCAAGPSSFNAELTLQGGRVVSCDPVYDISAPEIRRRGQETCSIMVAGAEANADKFIWREIKSPAHLGKIRTAVLEEFLGDYPRGLQQGRYQISQLPLLPYCDAEFDLALCGYFLFTYSDLFDFEFHVRSVRELCRVATESRIFPLLPAFATIPSPHLAPLMRDLSALGYRCEIVRVPYEFQKGGNEMLRVRRRGLPFAFLPQGNQL
jgi:hypothetical protein